MCVYVSLLSILADNIYFIKVIKAYKYDARFIVQYTFYRYDGIVEIPRDLCSMCLFYVCTDFMVSILSYL